jgi:hypothetical protein
MQNQSGSLNQAEHFMEIMKIAMSFADATTKPNLERLEHQQDIITDADSNDIRANTRQFV